MKRITVVCFVCVFSVSFAFSQNVGEYHDGGQFSKKVEYNFMRNGVYNVKSKWDIEKLFFGDFNAMAEFCYNPSSEVNPFIPSGFRIIRDSSDTYFILEVKRVSNYREAAKVASTEIKKALERQMIDIPVKLLDSLPRDVLKRIFDYNETIFKNKIEMYYEELPKHFKVEIKSIPISNQFAEKLYKMMVSFIGNFKAKGIPPVSTDGYSVSFRTVVADEVWSLEIHMPKGKASLMTNLCLDIISDANDDQLEESTYISVLDEQTN
ncbi:hypothetical protein MASR2M47_31010 [Draconibacterium sp.]